MLKDNYYPYEDVFGAITSGVLGMASAGINYGIQKKLMQEDRAENYRYNEMAAQNADARTRALYRDIYSPEALLGQYREAGLSPSMMYGGTPGQGGMSGAQGGGANGPTTPYYPVNMLEMAQAANLMAQTKKTEAETKNIDPIANATVSSLLADAGYKEASAAAAKAQAAGIELDNYVKENTKDASVYMICERADQAGYEAEKAYYEMKDAKLLNDFNKETFDERVQIVKNQMELLAQSIAESKSLQRLNEEQRKYIKVSMLDIIDTANREWAKYELSTEQFETFLNKQIPLMEKELDTKFKDLDIKEKKLIIDAVTETFKGLAMGAMAASSMGLGKGGNLSPTPQQMGMKPKVKATHNGVPQYKNNTVWAY